jgi:hypothetical protein
MTDMEKFTKLYKSVGINVTPVYVTSDTPDVAYEIILKAKEHAKITGYAGFETVLQFDKDGKFLQQGIWE